VNSFKLLSQFIVYQKVMKYLQLKPPLTMGLMTEVNSHGSGQLERQLLSLVARRLPRCCIEHL